MATNIDGFPRMPAPAGAGLPADQGPGLPMDPNMPMPEQPGMQPPAEPPEHPLKARTSKRLTRLMEQINICDIIDDEDCDEIGATVVREYEVDENSRSDWLAKSDDAIDLAMQVTIERQYPWPKAANIKYPLLTTASIQFAARAYPALVGQGDAVKGKVIGADEDGSKRKRADRIARHMSYQLSEEMPEWEEDMDRLCHVLPVVGCVFKKTWYDPVKRRNVSVMVHAQKLVVNSNSRALKTTPRITQIMDDIYPYMVEENIRAGLWRECELGIPEGAEANDEQSPHTFLEQHRLLDLDDDGYPEPYIVTVHKDTSKVVRIVADFDEGTVTANAKGEVAAITRTEYFTKFSFLPSPDGSFYDVGFGQLLLPINEAINGTLNQLLDAGHLANVGGGLIGKGMRIKGGQIRFKPGEYVPVEVPGDNLRNNVLPFPFPGPNVVLFQLLGLLIEAGQDIAAVKDVLTGDQTSSDQSPTTTLALIEQGMKVFTSIYKRIFRSLRDEYGKLYRLNRLHLPEQAYFTVLDRQEAVAQQDYDAESADVVPVADPRQVSDMQQLARAGFLQNFMGDPLLNQMELRKRIFRASGIEDIEMLLVQEQPPDPALEEKADQIELKKRELDIKLFEAQMKVVKMQAETIKLLAEAEAVEVGPQITMYTEQMKQLTEMAKAAYGRGQEDGAGAGSPAGGGGVQGMAGAPGVPAIPGLPIGP